MPLRELLSAERIALLDEAPDRSAVLDAVATMLARPAIPGLEASDIASVLHQREELASTGIGHGVAVPHGRVGSIEDARAAFLRLGTPVDFGAADGQLVDLVLGLAVPVHHVEQHLLQLAEVAERFSDEGFRDAVRSASTPGALLQRLLEHGLVAEGGSA